MANKDLLIDARRKVYECDAETINFYRRNPCIAAEDLLGVRLVDSQKYIIQMSWNAEHIMWCCCRNFGKSFLGAIFMILKAVLYEDQAIYIVAPVGRQSKETFTKIEEIVLRMGSTAASINSLTDIVQKEIKSNGQNPTGFSHNPDGWNVTFYNGSTITALNGKPDTNRGKRATLVFFDEAAFCSEELIKACEPFTTQKSDFVTDTNDDFDPTLEKRKCPNQLIYASSQGEDSALFYRYYRDFAKEMFAGNEKYFVADMIADTAINVYMNGKKYAPLLTMDKVEQALRDDEPTAMREYYNRPIVDGGTDQIVRWDTIRRNETFFVPEVHYVPGGQYVLAFDPARTTDNSILTIMKIVEDKDYGYIGEIVNCVNFVDIASHKKYKLDSNRQMDELHNYIRIYNDTAPDYENIKKLLIDQGAGGGGTSTYADGLLKNWTDVTGREHRGMIDFDHPIYEGYDSLYPDAVDIVDLINPKKYRTQMVEEFIELMNLGCIKFPYDSTSNDTITLFEIDPKTGEENAILYKMSFEEQVAMMNIKMLKREITSIQKYENAEKTAKTYALRKELGANAHDDRFYTIIMLAHYLYELRRGQKMKESASKKKKYNFSIRPPKPYK